MSTESSGDDKPERPDRERGARSGEDRPRGDRPRGRREGRQGGDDRGRSGYRRDDARLGGRRDDRQDRDRPRGSGRGDRGGRPQGDRDRREGGRPDRYRSDGQRPERRGDDRPSGRGRDDERGRGGGRRPYGQGGGARGRDDRERRGFRGRREDDRGGPARRGGRDGGRDERRHVRDEPKRLPIDEDVTGAEIDKEVRQELRSLPKTLAEDVAKNLVMVARYLDEDPEAAYGYARVALRLASRVPSVREAAGFAAYAVEKYSEALAEFRAARRMTGLQHLWPVMADCERGMGRPERALAMAGEPEVQKLDKAGQVEMRLVAAGARRDMGQPEAAVVTLQSPELASGSQQPWAARLRYAYADALLEVGREDEAREWFAKALEADQSGATDASDRLAELDGLEFVDALDPEADEESAGESGEEGAGEGPEGRPAE